MLKNKKHTVLFLLLFFITTFTSTLFAYEAKINYWNTQRKGANIFNEKISPDIWKTAAQEKIQFVRLATDKWHGKEKDFLIANADHYTKLNSDDVNQLRHVLADANQQGIRIVLTMLSLPGARWKQLNHDQDDHRLWREADYQQQAIRFWQDLAKELRDNPAIVAYNIINEPHPEVAPRQPGTAATLADLNRFNQLMVNAIREVDKDTPIILDTGLYGDPRTFSYLKPVQGQHILYAFHMYEPFHYTNKKLNNGKYAYPGEMNKAQLASTYLSPVVQWQQRYHIPGNRIIAGEFGGHRSTKGLAQYFHDLITLFDEQGWHWAFYSYREDTWDGMDYELGEKPLGAKYWEARNRGEQLPLQRVPNPIWEVLKSHLQN